MIAASERGALDALKNGNVGEKFMEPIPYVLPTRTKTTVFTHKGSDFQSTWLTLTAEVRGVAWRWRDMNLHGWILQGVSLAPSVSPFSNAHACAPPLLVPHLSVVDGRRRSCSPRR